MIRVLLVDDHPVVLVGLERLVRSEPGFVHVGSACNGSEALAEAERTRPDCMMLDYQIPDGGMILCRRLEELRPAPSVVLYTAFAGERLAVAALVAGVNAVLDKAATASEIFDSMRLAARGRQEIQPSQPALADVASELDPEQLAIFGMRIEGTPWADIGETLRLRTEDLDELANQLLERIEGLIAPGRPLDAVGS